MLCNYLANLARNNISARESWVKIINVITYLLISRQVGKGQSAQKWVNLVAIHLGSKLISEATNSRFLSNTRTWLEFWPVFTKSQNTDSVLAVHSVLFKILTSIWQWKVEVKFINNTLWEGLKLSRVYPIFFFVSLDKINIS